jgi:hypothetical protein
MRFPNCGFLPQISHCCAMTAVDPFRGLDGNFYSTGFRAFGTIGGFVLWRLSLKVAAVCSREIPRPAGENAGLRDDAVGTQSLRISHRATTSMSVSVYCRMRYLTHAVPASSAERGYGPQVG